MKRSGKPILIIMLGAPGSGKTHIAEQFSKKNHLIHVNSDSVRAKFFSNPQFTQEERERVYVKIHQVVSEELDKGNNVILDGNLLTNDIRFDALQHYREMNAKVLFVYLDTPSDIAIKRALSRQTTGDGLYKAMPEDRAVRMHKTFESPDPKLPQVVITNVDDYETVDRLIVEKLAEWT